MSYKITTECFELTANGLKAINTDDLAIGQKVMQARDHEDAIITAKTSHGYTVTFEDGRQSHGQTVGALSPYTRITAAEPAEIVSAEDVERLNALAIQYREAQRKAQEEAARKKAADTARIVGELRQKYPWAVSGEGLTNHARAAKNMREELKRAFPGVKFSVRSESYSGGDSINVKWTLGPSPKEVEAVTNTYQDGNFDGMQDIHEYDNSAYGNAVDTVLGRVKYVFCVREIPEEISERVDRGLCWLQGVTYAGSDTVIFKGGWSRDAEVSCQRYRLLALTSFAVSFEGEMFIQRSTNNDWDHFARIVFPEPVQCEPVAATAPASLSADGVTVTQNEEKNGVEIRFDAKPSDEIRDALKANGFRWSRFQSVWYARRSGVTLAFAQSLVN